MKEFKAGDNVYCPKLGGNIFTLKDAAKFNAAPYSLFIQLDDGRVRFTAHGQANEADCVPSLFHATPENHQRLSDLHSDIEFEKPKLKGVELAKKLCERGEVFFAMCSNDEMPLLDDNEAIFPVIQYCGDTAYSFETKNAVYKFVLPIEIVNNKVVEREE
ncbi:hypothetical protein [Phocoenobacter skyensis]|uniref:Uncharacterized protein n=1 Tax=Phocoenobacter skyensis TaxID=97481 RepID=A0A1H7XN30_9PAST|nr:hypothetical protein [Pasteurella skyensis]MDP8184363.1 hypothetical protein [Pasteurella skyensis]QLB22629.1 hypothetical protein A6B44_05175 [Pasteurella skyensis]SEM34628.1 hypothetical protein SAMN05444853_11330 [Pasteurella skyensis]